jgi:hypothetical protein
MFYIRAKVDYLGHYRVLVEKGNNQNAAGKTRICPKGKLQKMPFKIQEMPLALKREHPALQNMTFLNFFYFCGTFCPPGSGLLTLLKLACLNL